VKFAVAAFPVLPTARILYIPAGAPEATVNPTAALPLPVMLHDGADRTVEGAAVSKHDTSLVNPVALPLTMVPVGPEYGVRVKVPTGPAVTVKGEEAESRAPRFDVTVTT
jgi:hypothetical protein